MWWQELKSTLYVCVQEQIQVPMLQTSMISDSKCIPEQLLPSRWILYQLHQAQYKAIRRAFYVVRNILQLLERDSLSPDPTDCGWTLNKEGFLLPDKCLKSVPDAKLIVCKCQAGCERNCSCKRAKQYCVVFCHKKQRTDCQNRHVWMLIFVMFMISNMMYSNQRSLINL